MNCPTDDPKTATQPHFMQGVTLSTITGRVNIHLDEGLDMVYVADALDPEIHAGIALLSSLAYVENARASATWEGGGEPGGNPPGPYCKRDLECVTLEGKRGLVPWSYREDP